MRKKPPPTTTTTATAKRRPRPECRPPVPRPGRKAPGKKVSAEAKTTQVLQELQVHQIELEMQNAELQAARNELEEALEKYTDLYDFAPVGYLTLDPEGVIREANLAGANLLGIARSTLTNRRFGSFVATADRPAFSNFLQKVYASKARQGCELTLQLAGRRALGVDLEAVVFASGRACRVTLMDITERRRAEADRQVLNKLESTGILAGGIAHDFNNLLTVILLNVELAQMLNRLGEESECHLEEAKQTALLARGLTSQLLTFAQGGAPIRQPMSISSLLQESVRLALSGSKVRCEFSLPEDLREAEVDAGQIGQVLRNLVLNAREAMPQAGMIFVGARNAVLSARDQPSLPPGEYVRVSITDQGPGIAEDVLPKIFDPYFSTKQRGQQKGMGLGLTICHAVVQKHGGAIAVESELGAGTTFHVFLPAARKVSGGKQAAEPAGEKIPVAADLARPARVLVMDDEEGVRKVFRLTLQGLGHEVELAEAGQQAVEVFQAAAILGRPFDVVILDLTVRAGMGGQETKQALRKLDPAVKAVAMSGYAQDPVILEPERHGFIAALAKPFDVSKLRALLSRILTDH